MSFPLYLIYWLLNDDDKKNLRISILIEIA